MGFDGSSDWPVLWVGTHAHIEMRELCGAHYGGFQPLRARVTNRGPTDGGVHLAQFNDSGSET